MRGTPCAAAGVVADAVTGVVPATVIVTVRVSTCPLGPPPTDSVYVVVAVGDSRAEPRAITGPTPGVTNIAPGFSATQDSTMDSPGLIEVRSASNDMIRASGHGNCGGRLQPRVVWACALEDAISTRATKRMIRVIRFTSASSGRRPV